MCDYIDSTLGESDFVKFSKYSLVFRLISSTEDMIEMLLGI